MRRTIGVNTWVWTSPLDDDALAVIAAKAAGMGFGAIELPVEQPGDWSPDAAADVLAEHRLAPVVIGAMGPGRNLVAAPGSEVVATQNYLVHCVGVAERLGSRVVAGPFTAATGRAWRMDAEEREARYRELRAEPRARRAHGGAQRHPARHRTAEPLRDEPREHRRAGARGARPAARAGARARARQLPPQHRGEGHRCRDPRGRGTPRVRAGLRQRPRARSATTTSTGRPSSTRSTTSATTVRSDSRASPARTPRSPSPPRCGGRSLHPRTNSRSAASATSPRCRTKGNDDDGCPGHPPRDALHRSVGRPAVRGGRAPRGRVGLRRPRDRVLRRPPRPEAGRRGARLPRRAPRDPEAARPRGVRDLEPPRRAGGVRRAHRLPARGDPALVRVGRRRRRGRAAARGRGHAALGARGAQARRRHGRRLHGLVDLALRGDVPAGARVGDRGRVRGLRDAGGTRSSTCSTPRACGSRTRCIPARSPTTTGARCAPSRRSTTARRSASTGIRAT